MLKKRASLGFIALVLYAVLSPITAQAAADDPAERLRAAINNLTTPYTLQINDPDFNLEQFEDTFDFTGVREWNYKGMRTASGTTLTWIFTWNEVHAVTAAYNNPALEAKLSPDQKETLDKCRSIFNTIITGAMNDYEKEKAIHDYLCRNVIYDKVTTDTQDTSDLTPFTAYGALIAGKAVCQGYVNAAALLLTMCGIENYILESETHTWNLVKLDDGYYHMDSTWDGYETGQTGAVQYSYLNLTDVQITRYKEHRFKNRANFPPAQATTFNYYLLNGLTAGSLDDIRRITENACAAGDPSVTMWVANHQTHPYNWQEDLTFVTQLTRGGNWVSGYTFIPPGADRDTLTILFK